MIRFVWSHVRGRAGRSLALLAGVLVATTGFTVLSGTTATARLQVTGVVSENARAAYDILVRPVGTRLPMETDLGLVQPHAMSALYGGITMRQYEQVQHLAGVDVAAPVAVLGYANTRYFSAFDITDVVDPSLDGQIIRIDPTFSADRGLSRASGQPSFVYITKHRLSWPILEQSSTSRSTFFGGEVLGRDEVCHGSVAALDLDAAGQPTRICGIYSTSVATERGFNTVEVVRLRPDGKFERGRSAQPPAVTDRLVATVRRTLSVLVAGIDPVAEDRLVGLRNAVDTGRYLTPDDRVTPGQDFSALPVLASSRSYIDSSVEAAFSRLPPDTPIAGISRFDLGSHLGAVPPGNTLARQSVGGEPGLQQLLADDPANDVRMSSFVRAGAPQYDRAPDGTLVVRTVDPSVSAYDTFVAPWQSDDTTFRTLTEEVRTRQFIAGRVVGTYDPAKLRAFSELSRVPMETYEPPGVTGADQRSKDLLGGNTLAPEGNPSGYVAAPPLLLTNLAALSSGELSSAAPISAIRVRVADVTGFTETSRERVRVVAEQIATRTGLEVDITYGSSATPQTVELAAGVYGRPVLHLNEGWSKKGVAAAIVNAVDRKSVVLFLLVLVVCTLFLVNAVAAAVRDRRSELAVLACLGWPGRRIGLAILAEVLGIGLAAGLLGLGISAPLGIILGVRLTWSHAVLAVPVALGLTLVAGIVPAVRAARTHPAGALHPAVRRPRRPRRARTVLGLALTNLGRVPGRTLLGTVALAIGVAALSMLMAVTFAFRGAIVGTALGDVVSLRVRGVDTVAIVATVLFSAVAVADVLYLNIRDRAHELASLQAAGWSAAALGRLVTYEGLCIGVLGAVLGAGAGLAGASLLVGGISAGLVNVGVLTALAGVLVAAASAAVPALLLRRLPVAQLLAEE
ncbi:FtsX-like permease family protein [Dactylosporangium darangshiense]